MVESKYSGCRLKLVGLGETVRKPAPTEHQSDTNHVEFRPIQNLSQSLGSIQCFYSYKCLFLDKRSMFEPNKWSGGIPCQQRLYYNEYPSLSTKI